jgi:dTDP-4-dehydrorhamnose 3,5-epimerase
MIFHPTPMTGLFLIAPEARPDARGSFARTYCARTFQAHDLGTPLPVTARAINHRAFTLRGLHFQDAPHEETKLVSCAQGRIFDVVVDLRLASPTHGQWHAVDLDAAGGDALYVPPGLAHGYLTLMDNTVVTYQMTDSHHPDAERGIRWDDPELCIPWPFPPAVISPRDRDLPFLSRGARPE